MAKREYCKRIGINLESVLVAEGRYSYCCQNRVGWKCKGICGQASSWVEIYRFLKTAHLAVNYYIHMTCGIKDRHDVSKPFHPHLIYKDWTYLQNKSLHFLWGTQINIRKLVSETLTFLILEISPSVHFFFPQSWTLLRFSWTG